MSYAVLRLSWSQDKGSHTIAPTGLCLLNNVALDLKMMTSQDQQESDND